MPLSPTPCTNSLWLSTTPQPPRAVPSSSCFDFWGQLPLSLLQEKGRGGFCKSTIKWSVLSSHLIPVNTAKPCHDQSGLNINYDYTLGSGLRLIH